MSDNDRREGAVFTTFRTADDHERAVILGRKIKDLQESVLGLIIALTQVSRQADDLLEYQQVLAQNPTLDDAGRRVLAEALSAYAWTNRTSDPTATAIADDLIKRFGLEGEQS